TIMDVISLELQQHFKFEAQIQRLADDTKSRRWFEILQIISEVQITLGLKVALGLGERRVGTPILTPKEALNGFFLRYRGAAVNKNTFEQAVNDRLLKVQKLV
ncbi:unnamed protein product, partial [Didymodactylos carnosus]